MFIAKVNFKLFQVELAVDWLLNLIGVIKPCYMYRLGDLIRFDQIFLDLPTSHCRFTQLPKAQALRLVKTVLYTFDVFQ